MTSDPEFVLKGVPPSADQLHELEILIRAHHPLLLVDTVEEQLKGNSSLKEVLFVALDTRELKPFEAKIGGGV